MNMVYENPCIPLRVILVNATHDCLVMIAIKILRGVIFGIHQLVDLILVVYENDKGQAQGIKWNLEASAFPCNNSITVTSDIPRITDADVFIFISNFSNPNSFNIDKIDDDEHFESLYLFLRIADNFEMPPPDTLESSEEEKFKPFREAKALNIKSKRRPIIIGDGVMTIDIIKSFSRNLPDDIFFCPTSIATLSKSILGDYLKVHANDLNHVYVWAANDTVFHVDIQSPIYLRQKSTRRGLCEWDVMANRDIEDLNIDSTQFNASWLKKDFLEKILATTTCHPYGHIYKSAKITNCLQNIWKTRSMKPDSENKCNMGVISDGSLGTIKGMPYFLPVIFTGDSFTINEYLKEEIHLKMEITRINKAAWDNHLKIKNYCKKFIQKHIIGQEFMGTGEVNSSEIIIQDTQYEPRFPNARGDD